MLVHLAYWFLFFLRNHPRNQWPDSQWDDFKGLRTYYLCVKPESWWIGSLPGNHCWWSRNSSQCLLNGGGCSGRRRPKKELQSADAIEQRITMYFTISCDVSIQMHRLLESFDTAVFRNGVSQPSHSNKSQVASLSSRAGSERSACISHVEAGRIERSVPETAIAGRRHLSFC